MKNITYASGQRRRPNMERVRVTGTSASRCLLYCIAVSINARGTVVTRPSATRRSTINSKRVHDNTAGRACEGQGGKNEGLFGEPWLMI
ncbi:hypothetical protein Hypma_002933 [Hypsizygus marmoreus]|uniref:Uncharacterized protein n=1 Tax=Hypsizygus marmoreus TaxID=39966 RepID=A0A369J3K5_HYPMA|nr:hypothetical protein Hypma_002933 [Hypsizygus marmoreus]